MLHWTDKDHFYRVVLSSRFQEIELWKPRGGFLHVAKADVAVGKSMALEATTQVGKLEVKLDRPTWKTSEVVGFSVALSASEALREDDFHTVRAEVTDGAGKYRRFYRYCIASPGGKGRGEIPLALNDPTGTWKLRLTDVATGVAAEVRFGVER